jgi:cytochrome b
MSIIGGLILIGIGSLMVIYTEWLVKNFGRINWFEKNLGTGGGTRLGYKLMGIIIVFLGLLLLTGLMDGFLGFTLSPLTGSQL